MYVNSLEINFMLKRLIIWLIDLIDLSNIKNKFYSKNYAFALPCIDAFTRYVWVEPMKNKTAVESKKAI